MDNIRQGDVLIRRISNIPSSTIELPVGDDGIVLARGEKHGHIHKIVGNARFFFDPDQQSRYLHVEQPSTMEHVGGGGVSTGEHDTLEVPVGDYEVIQQRQAEGTDAVYRED